MPRAARLARHGELIQGTVRHVGGVKDFDPLRRIDFSYTFNGQAYRKKMWGGESRSIGSRLALLIDPSRPSRVMFACDGLPKSSLREEIKVNQREQDSNT